MIKYTALTIEDICESFGILKSDFPDICKTHLQEHDFSYKILSETERDSVLLTILKNIENVQSIKSPERINMWENGWRENLEVFRSEKNISSLEPKYLKHGQPIRFRQNFILGKDPMFIINFIKLFQLWFFSQYANYSNIYEFGCGTGLNTIVLSKMFPKAKLFAFDFVKSSINLVNEISSYYKFKVKTALFDMKTPNYSVEILPNSCVFTCGAIEQLSDEYRNFISFLIEKRPKLCFHQEPILELLDENNLSDYLAMQYQIKKRYPKDFLTYLRALEKTGKIKILKVKRLFFGSLMGETYNYIIWSPIS